ncbi:MAG: hypothetical protein ACI3XL_06270 [Eubacteriales bacterium]
MDFELIEKKEVRGICYKLLRTNFYRNYFVIIAQTRSDFYCSSFYAPRERAEVLFDEIADSATEPYTIADILQDFAKETV